MSYRMSLTTAEGVELSIPVLPEDLKVSSPGSNKTVTVLGLGEVSLLRKKGLRSVEWSSHFPAHKAPYVSGRIKTPIDLVRIIQQARDSLEPLAFSLRGGDLDINTQMGVESFDYEERGGEPGDLYYTIKLTEWKDYAPKWLKLVQDGDKALEDDEQRSGASGTSGTYTVVSGDSLWAIAKRAYGSGARWNEIYQANRATVGANPNKIYPGQVLTIP